ncbi:MAG TPA: NAD-binding protein [Kutzneria sp.]|jgi:3-hydroxyisobutyrate dehydrogenase-like beta-hydroxyacid dehydrogenase
MGTPLIARLVASGHDVVATDIRDRRAAVEALGGRWVPDLRSCDVLLTVLPGNAQLVLYSPVDCRLWIDLTSGSPDVAGPHLDAPMGGGVSAMREGTITLYVGGPSDVLADATPLLRSFASTIHHVGASGAGYLAKLLINLQWFGHALLATEALLLASRHGLSGERMQSLLVDSAGDSAFASRHLPSLLAGDYLRDFGLDRCLEELESVARAASAAGTPHRLTSLVTELHRAALDRFGPVDGELMGPALLEEQAGFRLSDG